MSTDGDAPDSSREWRPTTADEATENRRNPAGRSGGYRPGHEERSAGMSPRVWLAAVAVAALVVVGAYGSVGAPTPHATASLAPGGPWSPAGHATESSAIVSGPPRPSRSIDVGPRAAESTPPGARLAGGFSAEGAALSGQFQADVYEVRLARAPTASARAAVLRSIRVDLRNQLDAVLATRASLADNESLPPGEGLARRSAATVRAAVTVRLAESAQTVAESLSGNLLPIDLVGIFGDLVEDARAVESADGLSIGTDGNFDLSDYATPWADVDFENETGSVTTEPGTSTITVPDVTDTPTISTPTVPEPTLTTPPVPEPTVPTPTVPEPTLTTPSVTVPVNETLTDPL